MCVLNVENFMLFCRLSLVTNTEMSYYESIMVSIYSVRELWLFVCLLVFNATLSNTLDIPWRPVLLVEETDIPGKTTNLPHVTDKLYYFMLYRIHLTMNGIRKSSVGGTRVLIVQVVVNHDDPRQDLYSRWLRPHKICYSWYIHPSVIFEMHSEQPSNF